MGSSACQVTNDDFVFRLTAWLRAIDHLPELRVYIVDWAFIAAIAIGESIELCMFAWLRGWPFDLAKANEEGIAVILLRQPLTLKNSGNIQRVVCFVFKIFVCVILKTSVQDSAWLYPSLSVFD